MLLLGIVPCRCHEGTARLGLYTRTVKATSKATSNAMASVVKIVSVSSCVDITTKQQRQKQQRQSHRD